MKRTIAVAALAVLTLSPLRAGDCGPLVRIVSLDMLPSSSTRVMVPTSIGDKPLRMVLDTGGYLTALTEEKAQELGLSIDVRPASRIVLLGGHVLRRFVTVSDFRLGRLKAGRLDYPLLPLGFMEPGADGILGADFLANFDLDFDFAGGKVNLFSQEHCDGKVGYWTDDPPIGIPIVREEDRAHISTHVTVEGKDAKALIDTGSPRSLMSLELAESILDVRDDDPRFVYLATGPNKTTGARRFPIKIMSFGGVEVKNPDIVLTPESQMRMGPRSPRMILGLSILRQLHLYIAYHEKMLYVTAASVHK